MAGLTGTHISTMLRAAGASPSGLVATPAKIADLFNTAILKYGDGLFTTTDRVAALVSECMMESAYFRTTEEYAKNGRYAPYIGRTFIQLTWSTIYAAFGAWCKAKGLVPDKNYFVNNPKQLADVKWAALGGVWYFTHVKFSGKPLVEYAGNIEQVGKAVNLGNPFSSATPNGEAARRAAYAAVKSIGKAIVPTPPPGQVKDAPGTSDVTKTTHVDVDPTANAIHTPFGQWGPDWSWNRGKNSAHPTWGQHGGDDWHRNAGDAEIGDPIYAVADGRVIFAGASASLGWGPSFGNHVLITWSKTVDGDGGLHRTSIDAHMNKTVAKYGQNVKAGDLIGYKGKTGNVTGAHDHHEQHLGQGWGDKRVKPVYPGRTTTQITEVEQEFLDMSHQDPTKHRTKSQTVSPTVKNKPKVLYLDDKGNVTWAFGAGEFEVECFVRFTGPTANGELMIRPMYVDTDKKSGKAIDKGHYDYTLGLPGGDGKSYRKLSFRIVVGSPKAGRTRRNRIAVENYTGQKIVVTEVITKVWRKTA